METMKPKRWKMPNWMGWHLVIGWGMNLRLKTQTPKTMRWYLGNLKDLRTHYLRVNCLLNLRHLQTNSQNLTGLRWVIGSAKRWGNLIHCLMQIPKMTHC